MKPDLQAILLADKVYREVSGKWIIAGTFNRIVVGTVQQRELVHPDGTKQRQISHFEKSGSHYVYICLSNVRGKVPLTVRFVSLLDHEVLLETTFEIECNSPLDVAQLSLPFPGLPELPIPHCPGDYAIELLYHDDPIGVHRIRVDPAITPAEGEKQ